MTLILTLVMALLLALTGLPLLPLWAAPPTQTAPPQGVSSNSTSISPQWIPYDSSDGLISNNVTTILAKDQAIWFGTDAGISRFDGTWVKFESGGDVPQGAVTVLADAGAGDEIWMATDLGFLGRWDGQSWQPMGELASRINALAPVDSGMWAGTDVGLFALIPSGDEPNQMAVTPVADLLDLPDVLSGNRVTAVAQSGEHIFIGTDSGLWSHNGEWKLITAEDGLPSSAITAIWISPTGSIWAGTQAGAARWDRASDKWEPYRTNDLSGNPLAVHSLQGDNLGIVWAGSESGAYQFTEDGRSLQLPGDVGLTTAFVQAIAPDDQGYVWLGTVAGVFRYGRDLWTYERRNDVQPEEDGSTTFYIGINSINDLLVDGDGALWIASDAGVRHKGSNIDFGDEIYYTRDNSGLPSDRIKVLAEASNGDIWAGTETGIARFRDGQWEEVIAPVALPHPIVHALAPSSTGLWIGTEAGLVFFDQETEQLDPTALLDEKAVTALAFDGRGHLWIGTRDDGLLHLDNNGTLTPPILVENALSGQIVSLARDQGTEDGMWVGVTQLGISHWNGRTWTNYSTAQGLPSNVLHTLRTFPGEVSLWIGSEAGVTRFDGRSWGSFGVKEGELSPSIQAVARTSPAGFWFGGRDGLTFYRPEQEFPWVTVVTATGLGVLDRSADDSEITLELTGEELRLGVAAGDLHTPQEYMTILYRWITPNATSDLLTSTDRELLFPISEVGVYQLEISARDLAFNYSDFKSFTFNVVSPPSTVNLPLIGPVRAQVFQTMLALSLIAVLAFAYVSGEILRGRRRVRAAMVRGYNPYISGEPVRRDDMFFGREALLQRILDTLHSNSIMIHGERRIGKTTLLYQLGSRLRETDDPDYWFLPIYVDLEGTAQEEFFHFLIEEIVSVVRLLPNLSADERAVLGLLDFVDMYATDYSDRDFSRDLRTLLEILNEYGESFKPDQQLRLILLMDEMDVMSRYDQLIQQQLRRIFMRDFSSTLGAVVAGIQISKAWDRVESPWFNMFNEIELTPFDREQATELLEEPVREVYSYDPAALEAIIEHSNGRPFRLQQYGLEAVNHMLAQNRNRITLADVDVAHTRIQEQIDMNGTGQPDGDLALYGHQSPQSVPAPERDGPPREVIGTIDLSGGEGHSGQQADNGDGLNEEIDRSRMDLSAVAQPSHPTATAEPSSSDAPPIQKFSQVDAISRGTELEKTSRPSGSVSQPPFGPAVSGEERLDQ